MHRARVCTEDGEGSSIKAKTPSFSSTAAAAVHCAVTVQIPRFIPSSEERSEKKETITFLVAEDKRGRGRGMWEIRRSKKGN